jgi:hypothetical protein
MTDASTIPLLADTSRLEHVCSAVALNLIRLHAWWNGRPLDRTRTSHLTHLAA